MARHAVVPLREAMRNAVRNSIHLACALCACFLAAASSAAPTVRNRADIAPELKWDFTAIYPSLQAWEEGMREMDAKMQAFPARQGTLAQGPAAVLAAYQAFDEIGKLQYRLYWYAQLQRDIDTRDQVVAARFQRVTTAFAKFRTASAWFTPELLKIPEATMTSWIAQTPGLAPYRFPILDSYRRQAHVLDDKGERLLSLGSRLNAAPSAIYADLSTADIKFPTLRLADGSEVLLTPANYGAVLGTDRDQADRGRAAAAHVGAYGATANSYAAIYNAILQRDWYLAQARNFGSTLDAAVDSDAVPPSVVETLIEATRAGTAPLQRYLRLRKKLLGLQSYHLYDNQVALFADDKTYPYAQMRELAIESVAPLGADYVAKYRQFVSGGRVDVYETEGKRSGAYMAGVYGVGPYLLMNYNDTLDAAFTLAHEAGHAMHTVLSFESQPFATASYTIFVAEVASTTNERFLLDRMLQKTSDPKERFLLLQHAVDSIVGTFYTQVLFADFELRAHRLVEQGQPVTTDALNALYAGLLKEYWGDALTADDFYKLTWARIPHFFRTPYYVYQYATCFASSARLFDAMTSGPAEARQAATARYLTLLRSGGNDHPMEQLKKAGVDLSQRATIQAVVDQMDRLVSQMEVEAAKIR
jgi:oligoendopeptidase F